MSKPNFTDSRQSEQDDLTLTATIFKDVKAQNLEEKTFTWSQLVEHLTECPTYTHKQALPLISFCRYTGQRTDKGSLRAGEFVTSVTGLEIDYDGGEITIDEARNRLQAAGLISVIYSTPSCLETDDNGKELGWRWRAILPLSEPIPGDQRQRYIAQLNYIFDGKLARESFNLSQSFYVGRVRSVYWQTETTDGTTLDALDLMQTLPLAMPDHLMGASQPVSDPRDKNDAVGFFCRAFDAPTALERFLPDVFEHVHGKRWTWIGHLAQGVWVHDNQQHVGASHDSWPFGTNKLANTFDVVRQFKFDPKGDEALDMADLPIWRRPSYKMMLSWMDSLPEVRSLGWRYDGKPGAASPMDFELVDQEVEKLQEQGDQGYPLFSMDELAAQPEVKWLIKGVLPAKSLSMIYGASGSGKSFLALDIAAAISGHGAVCSHYGHPADPRRLSYGSTIYVVAEGFGGFGQRVEAYIKHFELAANAISKDQFAVLGATPNLGELEDIARIRQTVKAQMGGHIDLIVLDTLAAVSAGVDENSKEILQIFDVAQRLIAEFGCAVLMVHHTGKDAERGARGFSGIRAALDAEIKVERVYDEAGNPHWYYQLTKQKDARDGDRFGFALEPVELGLDSDGDQRSSLVVKHLAEPVDLESIKTSALSDGKKKKTGLGALQKAVIETIESVGPDNWITQKDLVDRVLKDYPDAVKGSTDPIESIKATARKMIGRVDLGGELTREREGNTTKYQFKTDAFVTTEADF